MVVSVVLGIVTVILAIVWWHFRKNRGYLESQGIPIVKPGILLGSPPYEYRDLWVHDVPADRIEKYGKTWGWYQGNRPVISTVEPEILKEILVKQFDNFQYTFDIDLIDKHKTVDFTNGELWRILRRAMTPVFTSGKLKAMLEPMDSLIDEMVTDIKRESRKQKEFDIRPFIQDTTLKITACCLMSVSLDRKRDLDNNFIKCCYDSTDTFQIQDRATDFFQQFVFHFPGLQTTLDPLYGPAFDKLTDASKQILKMREDLGDQDNRHDLAAQMIGLLKETRTNPEMRKLLNEDIIACQPSIAFKTGLETTAATLTNIFYLLATHSDVQVELISEIDSFMNGHPDGKFDLEDLRDLEYLDAVVNEGLRLYPAIHKYNRVVSKDCIIKGIKFKRGTIIEIPIMAAQRMQEFFPDADKFQPERFLSGNRESIGELTFRPFSDGPRQCVGKRFAQLVIKAILVKLMAKVKLVATPKTKLNLAKGDMFMVYAPEMVLEVQER